jgi:hypothetical protein
MKNANVNHVRTLQKREREKAQEISMALVNKHK